MDNDITRLGLQQSRHGCLIANVLIVKRVPIVFDGPSYIGLFNLGFIKWIKIVNPYNRMAVRQQTLT